MGNPGSEYAATRHNAGFWLADFLASRWSLGAWHRDRWYRSAEGHQDGHAVRIIKPQAYMNRSGAVLAPLRAARDFDPAEQLLVLVDDVALPPGRFRLRGAGSAGGHNGLKSIEAALGRRDYARLRIGVGAQAPGEDLADYVLDAPLPEEREAIDAQMVSMAEAVECWLAEGIEKAMTRFNRS